MFQPQGTTMIKEPLLSICIPTYNRSKALDSTLQQLSEQIDGIADSVEICISDNCSPDDTPEVLSKWERRLPMVRKRTEKNLGYDINAMRVAQLASGRYLWYIGDDDEMAKGTVKRLVTDIKSTDKSLGAIFVNQFVNWKKIMRFKYTDFKVFQTKAMDFPLNISFGGSICLNRAIAQGVIRENLKEGEGKILKKGYEEPILHGFIHSYLFMECMKRAKYIGVEPSFGMNFRARGELTTYKNKLRLELIFVKYYLEIRKYYPWFKDTDIYHFTQYWKKLLTAGVVPLEQPDLLPIYKSLYSAYVFIMRKEHRHFQLFLTELFEAFRSSFLGKPVLVPLHDLMRSMLRLPMSKKPDTNPIVEKDIQYTISAIDKLLSQ